MRKSILIIFLFLLFSLPATTAFAANTFVLDDTHTRIGFAVKHMVISSVQGDFKKFSGRFVLDNKNVLTSVDVTIDVKSIDTAVEKRDNHLRSPDFFDVATYPEMSFKSTEISHKGNSYTVIGDLTIKGVTKHVALTGELLGVIKDPWGMTRAGFHATGKINRQDFGINFSQVLETGGLLVGDEVKIILDVEGIVPPPAKK
jgi:polyisoprenoid-binding protein YceI